MKNPLIKEKLANYNKHYCPPSHILEHSLLTAIEKGMLSDALSALKHLNETDTLKLAKSELRSKKNALIAACSLYTRAAISGGVLDINAFGLYDICINHIEDLHSISALDTFHNEMLCDFVDLVNESIRERHSYPIAKVIKYIFEHLTNKLSTATLADIVHLTPDYLSKLFHQEMGISLIDYIQKQKIEAAKNFLVFTNLPITEISTLLSFCNPGYFSKIFRKHSGYSPRDFKNTFQPYF